MQEKQLKCDYMMYKHAMETPFFHDILLLLDERREALRDALEEAGDNFRVVQGQVAEIKQFKMLLTDVMPRELEVQLQKGESNNG